MPPKLQHFVPRFHLKNFLDSHQKRELLWVYERGKQTAGLRSLDHVAAQKDYYTLKTEDGDKVHDIEEALSRVESCAAPLLRRIQEGDTRLEQDDRMTLSVFLAFGCMRTPKFRGMVEEVMSEAITSFSERLARDPVRFAGSVKSAEQALGMCLGDPEELRQAIIGERVRFTTRPEYSLQVMLEDVFEHAAMFTNMIWAFRRADEDTPLVTSDNPVVLNNPSVFPDFGRPTPLALEVVFPISPKLLFVSTWEGHAGAGRMSGRLTRSINKMMALAAERYVYSSTEVPAIAKFLQQPRKGLIPDFLREEMKREAEAAAERSR